VLEYHKFDNLKQAAIRKVGAGEPKVSNERFASGEQTRWHRLLKALVSFDVMSELARAFL